MVCSVIGLVLPKVESVVEGSVRGIERSRFDNAPAGNEITTSRPIRRSLLPRPMRHPSRSSQPLPGSAKSRRNPGLAILKGLKRMWIPLVVLAVIGAGGFTVSKLHGIFGSDKPLTYSDTKTDNTKPFNPKHLRYEIFGPPGTTASISYFGADGDPEHADGVTLPWSLEFPITAAAAIGSIAAQGDGDSISCRILVDGVVKSEKTTNEVSAFASCMLKAA
jgi:nitrate reductase NapE component